MHVHCGYVTVRSLRRQQLIFPMLHIPNQQNPHTPLYCPEFSVQKIPTRTVHGHIRAKT